MSWPCRVRAAFLVLVGAALTAAPTATRAQGELAMNWSLCSPDGAASQSPTCQFDIGEKRLVLSFVPGIDVTQVVGWTVVVDYASNAATLPSWWQVQPGGCREGELVAGIPTGLEGACLDPWSATGSAIVQSYLYPRPGGDASQLRVIVGVGVPAGQAFSLSAGQNYLAAILSIHFGSTIGGLCPGCEAATCFVFNSAEIQRLPGAPGAGPEPFVTPAPSLGNHCTWGGGTSCTAVPTGSRTWGQIKTLYR